MKAFEDDWSGEYVGVGNYPLNTLAFPNSIRYTFDGVAVDAGTRVTIYSEPNFEGDILWDQVGPALIANVKFQTVIDNDYAARFFQRWQEPLQTIFPPEVREWSCTDMHAWNTGSLRIEGGEPIPQSLKDLVPEYAGLSNPTY